MAKRSNRIHRLRDIVAEEVSLVDRPANQRRFLLRKNASVAVDVASEPVVVEVSDSKPTVAGDALAKAFDSLLASAEAFDAETSPVVVLAVETIEEVEELVARLKNTMTPPAAPQKEEPMNELEKLVREAADRLAKLADIEEAKRPEELAEITKLLSGLAEQPAAAAEVTKARSTVVLREVAVRAMNLANRVSKGPIDKKSVTEFKRLAALLKSLVEKYPRTQKSEDGTAETVMDDATVMAAVVNGDLDALSAVFEASDHSEATTALDNLDAAVAAAEKRLDEEENPPAPAAPPAPDPSVKLTAEVAKLAAGLAKLAEENKDLRAKLAKSLETPGDRASRAEVSSTDGNGVDPDHDPLLFPANYNDKMYHEALEKRGRKF